MRTRLGRLLSLAATLAVLLVASVPAWAAPPPVRIGAYVSLTGAYASFGTYLRWSYERAVAQVNAAGGLSVGGVRRPVALFLLDDESSPVVASEDARRLILEDHVAALLSSCTPDLVDAGGLVADATHVPMVATCVPIDLFARERRWTYSWDVFFASAAHAMAAFAALDALGLAGDRTVALVYENSSDGIAFGRVLWPLFARRLGWRVVLAAPFPVGTTDFAATINELKARRPDAVFLETDTPTAVAFRRQMAEYGYRPPVFYVEKGASSPVYAEALGALADGTYFGGLWSPNLPYPGAAALAAAFERETHQPWGGQIAIGYTAAEILLQAIARAGSLQGAAINRAIGETQGLYVVGPVAFGHPFPHTAEIPVTVDLWRHGRIAIVWSPHAAALRRGTDRPRPRTAESLSGDERRGGRGRRTSHTKEP